MYVCKGIIIWLYMFVSESWLCKCVYFSRLYVRVYKERREKIIQNFTASTF